MNCVFDIETGPRPDEELASMLPNFEAPKNYKDPVKIQEYIDGERKDWLERAALSPVSGRVLAIGLRTENGNEIFADEEKSVLAGFWSRAVEFARQAVPMVGFNIFGFDLPFLMRRSWLHGVTVPDGIIDARGYYNGGAFVDLYRLWQCGDKSASIKLNDLAKYLGVGEKNGSGAEFAKLFATDKKLAVAYLENDLVITEGVAKKLGAWIEGRIPKQPRASKPAGKAAKEAVPAAPAATPQPAATPTAVESSGDY